MLEKTKRYLFLTGGLLFLLLGIIGILLPLLPTTPFLIIAAYCFSRSSPKIHRWLWTHPYLGPPLQTWSREGAISLRSKLVATGLILVSFIYAIFWKVPLLMIQCFLGLFGIGILFFLWSRPNPRQ